MIIIRHTHAEGTLVEGTVKGDGVYELIGPRTAHRFRWFPSLRQIGIQSSRDRVAQRSRINAAATALRAAGHEVEVEIDDTARPRAEVVADQTERLIERGERLDARADRLHAHADGMMERSDALTRDIPPGQPILIGHHSERAHRNRLEKSINLAIGSVRQREVADLVQQRADAAGRDLELSLGPRATAERIRRLEAEVRDIYRKLDGHERRFLDNAGEVYRVDRTPPATPGGDYEQSLRARLAQVREQLDHDRLLVATAIERGEYTPWGKDSVHVGDVVFQSSQAGARGHEVVRVNKVTVSVKTAYSWTDKLEYTRIRRVDCSHRTAE